MVFRRLLAWKYFSPKFVGRYKKKKFPNLIYSSLFQSFQIVITTRQTFNLSKISLPKESSYFRYSEDGS